MRHAFAAALVALAACGQTANDLGQGSGDEDVRPITPKAGAGVLPSAEPPGLDTGVAGILSRGMPLVGQANGGALTNAPRLTWRGGKIVAYPKVFNMFWGTSFTTTYAGERQHYDAFVRAMDGNWDFVKPLNQYGIGTISFLGSQVYEPDPPATLDDRDIRATVVWAIKNGHAPWPDASTVYQLFLPGGTNLTRGGGTSSMCKDFCGYHGSFDDPTINGGQSIRYIALPRPDCTGCSYAVSVKDRETVISSHEISEVATDADVNNHALGWYDDKNGEVGDICASAPTAKVKGFAVQAEWSNADNACVAPHDPVPDFSVGLTPAAVQVQRGSSAQVKIWASPLAGYGGTVSFSAKAPVGIEVKLPNAQLPANTYQMATLQVNDGLVPAQYQITFTLTDGALTHEAVLNVQVTAPLPPRTVFKSDAEAGLTGWQTTAAAGQAWRIETSTASLSGTRRFRSNGSGGYSAGSSSFLISPSFDLSKATSASLFFGYKAQLEQNYDWFSVYATSDNGAHWTRLKDVTGDSASFPYWAPTMALDLGSFAGKSAVRIAFGLQSDASVQGWGVAIDDVEVVAR